MIAGIVFGVAVAALVALAWRARMPALDAPPPRVPANRTVVAHPNGGYRVTVPFLQVEAWLPGEPSHHEMFEETPFGFQKVEEVGVTVRELDFTGCGLSWYRAAEGTDPSARLDEIVEGHRKRLWAKLLGSRDIRIAGRPAKESVMDMTHKPNEGTVRVRHVLVGGWVVAMHTFRHQAFEPDATVTRCLESLVVPPAAP